MFAPGLIAADDIAAVVTALEVPVSVPLLPGGPSVGALRDQGTNRFGTLAAAGGAAARAAFRPPG